MYDNGMNIDLKAEGDYTSLRYGNWFNQYIYDLNESDKDSRSEFEVSLLENKNMIFKACNKYRYQIQNDEEYGDLIQEGLMILQMTIDKYKPIVSGRKVKFSSYLFIMLDGYLQKTFNEKFRGIKLTQTAFQNGDTKYVDFKLDHDAKDILIESNSTIQISEDNIDLKTLIESKLNDKEKELINLYYMKGYSYSEMATFFKCSKQTIANKISAILKKLKGE